MLFFILNILYQLSIFPVTCQCGWYLPHLNVFKVATCKCLNQIILLYSDNINITVTSCTLNKLVHSFQPSSYQQTFLVQILSTPRIRSTVGSKHAQRVWKLLVTEVSFIACGVVVIDRLLVVCLPHIDSCLGSSGHRHSLRIFL
jgi:hypothetical protein